MKIIGFNSYKGGACRTTTCYNTIPYLCKMLGATEDKPLLVVDLDLDSMGMTKLIANGKICPKNKFDKSYSANSLFDNRHSLNESLADNGLEYVKDSAYFSYWAKAGELFGVEKGAVLFLGADAEAKPISDESYKNLITSSPLGNLIKYLFEIDDDDCMPVGLIFDCAAGMQKSTQLAVSYVGTSVVCMRPTQQFRMGTMQYLENNYPDMFGMRNCPEKHRKVILLPTSVSPIFAEAGNDTFKKISDLRDDAFDNIEWMANTISRSDECKCFNLNTSMIDSEDDDSLVGIPEVQRLKWDETVPLVNLTDGYTEDEEAALQRYEKLAKEIIG